MEMLYTSEEIVRKFTGFNPPKFCMLPAQYYPGLGF